MAEDAGATEGESGAFEAEGGGIEKPVSGIEMFVNELKAQRNGKEWTQVRLGTEIGYSGSYISDVERGDKLASIGLAQKLDEAFGLPGTFVRLRAAARISLYPAWFAHVVPYEQKAAHISGWELGIPGLLQTEDYCRALTRITRYAAPDAEVERMVMGRMERQEIFTGPKPPRVWYVLDEGALRRVVGSVSIMAGQLDKLITVATTPGNVIQVLTHAHGGGMGVAGMINIWTLREGEGSPVAYTEANRGGRLITDHAEVAERIMDVDMIRAAALSQRDSIAYMQDIRREYDGQ
jgi:transcriptional regulator with XRE-family HTH domain